MKSSINSILLFLILGAWSLQSCKPKNVGNLISADAATKTYVAPGKYDEFYNLVSGGFQAK